MDGSYGTYLYILGWIQANVSTEAWISAYGGQLSYLSPPVLAPSGPPSPAPESPFLTHKRIWGKGGFQAATRGERE